MSDKLEAYLLTLCSVQVVEDREWHLCSRPTHSLLTPHVCFCGHQWGPERTNR